MFGAVLTGGASRRMGRTKALVEVDGIPMAARVAGALRGAGCVTVVACGGRPDDLAPIGLAVLADPDAGAGPLGGILAVLEHVASAPPTGDAGADHDDWVLVAACDLAFLTSEALTVLIDAVPDHCGCDVVVARTGRREPACALWHASAHERLRHLYDAGVRAVHEALDALDAREVDVDPRALRNINMPADLDRYP